MTFASLKKIVLQGNLFDSLQEAAEFLCRKLVQEVKGMPLGKALPFARVCGHYLNLTGVAELHHRYGLAGKR